MGEFDVGFAAAFVAGLLSFLSPCVLPLVPPYICYMGGVTISQMTDNGGPPPGAHRRVFISSIAFVAGFTTVFVLFGATASYLGQLLAENMIWVSRIAGVLIIIMGAHFLGVIRIPFLNREARFQGPASSAGLLAAFIMGLAFAFGWTPCVGPVLAAILMVAGSHEQVAYGSALLGVYAAGIGVPFLIVAAAIGPFMKVLPGIRKHMLLIERLVGGLLIVTGILFLTGGMTEIGFWILETFPSLGQVG